MQNPSQSYYLHLESSFLSMVIDHVHGSIALVVEYGMYTITRPRTVKINAILISLCHTNWQEICGRLTKKNIRCWKPLRLYFCRHPCLINLRPSCTRLSKPVMSRCISHNCTRFSCNDEKYWNNLIYSESFSNTVFSYNAQYNNFLSPLDL